MSGPLGSLPGDGPGSPPRSPLAPASEGWEVVQRGASSSPPRPGPAMGVGAARAPVGRRFWALAEFGSEDEEGEDGEDDAPEDGANVQAQPDRASSNEPRVAALTVVDADQAETHQSAAPPTGAAASTNLPDPPAAPLA